MGAHKQEKGHGEFPLLNKSDRECKPGHGCISLLTDKNDAFRASFLSDENLIII